VTVSDLSYSSTSNCLTSRPLEELSEIDWRRSVDVNLTATFLTVKEFLAGMKARRQGCIITMSSAESRRPTGHSPGAYAAAKAGIETLTKSLALQAGPYGVRVNCLAPETILTERNQQQIPDDVKEQMCRAHPLQRLGTPADVPRPRSTWRLVVLTGQVGDAAGGWSSAERGVVTVMVVDVQPGTQGSGACSF
jgi:3-oxoacyl-[acyl-carrier protein] reductase